MRVGEDYGGLSTETYVANYVLYFHDARAVLKKPMKEKGEFPAIDQLCFVDCRKHRDVQA